MDFQVAHVSKDQLEFLELYGLKGSLDGSIKYIDKSAREDRFMGTPGVRPH